MIVAMIRRQKPTNIKINISENFTNHYYTKAIKNNFNKGDAHACNN